MRMVTDTSDTAPSDVDRRIVARQIGRTPRALESVAVRCVHGLPAVTKQAPFDGEERPFPTAYYVVCPHLVRQIDRLESGGAIKRLEAELASNEALLEATRAASRRHAQIDDRGSAIAASGSADRLKCLHAHAAFELAAGDHPLGAEVLREAAPRWCADARCARYGATGEARTN